MSQDAYLYSCAPHAEVVEIGTRTPIERDISEEMSQDANLYSSAPHADVVEAGTRTPIEKHIDKELNTTVEDVTDHPGTHEIKEKSAEGEDEVDFSFWSNPDRTLLEHCRESRLHKDKLLGVLYQRQKANLPVDDVDCVDKEGYGAIHYLVTKKHDNKLWLLESLVIRGGSDVDLTTTKQRNTALHLAVEHNDLECAQALVSLDADVNKENLDGNTPLDLANAKVNLRESTSGNIQLSHMENDRAAVKSESVTEESESTAKKIKELLQSVGTYQRSSIKENIPILKTEAVEQTTAIAAKDKPAFRKINTTYYKEIHDEFQKRVRDVSQPVESKEAIDLVEKMIKHEEYRRKYGSRILCLDGGGIRGLIQITILREIERRTQRKITELFDWIVGTSTGGIIALALSYGPPDIGCKTVCQLRNIYWSMKDVVFGEAQSRFLGFLEKGNSKNMEENLQKWLGKDTTLSDTAYTKVLIPAVYKKDTNLELHFFNNCFNDAYSNELVWKVARYTSAAPFYFKEFENYIDGGMLVNNPSDAALTVIQDFYHEKGEKIPISMVVSVGAGINPGTPLGKIDIKSNLFNPSAYFDLLEVFGVAMTDGKHSSSCASRCREQAIDYFRFEPELTQKIALDEIDSQVLHEMIRTTRQYLNSKKGDVDRLVQMLMKSELSST